MNARRPLYAKADFRVEVTEDGFDNVVRQIVEKLHHDQSQKLNSRLRYSLFVELKHLLKIFPHDIVTDENLAKHYKSILPDQAKAVPAGRSKQDIRDVLRADLQLRKVRIEAQGPRLLRGSGR
ncbi:MAG: hypothetical protein R2688_06280 [Fimbriimonadaceae bacterium]